MKVWFKVHFYSTNKSRICMYISTEKMREYQQSLAERPAGCCAFFRSDEEEGEDEEQPKTPQQKVGGEASGSNGSSAPTSPRRVSISGVQLGLIPPRSPSGEAVDLRKVAMGTHAHARKQKHHMTTMLPRDSEDGGSGFGGFGEADAGDEEAGGVVGVRRPHRMPRRRRAPAPGAPACADSSVVASLRSALLSSMITRTSRRRRSLCSRCSTTRVAGWPTCLSTRRSRWARTRRWRSGPRRR
jgi:hypothetical protein